MNGNRVGILRPCLWATALATGVLLGPAPAQAWGDPGHETVALIANHYMTPAVKAKIQALLASDTDAFQMRSGQMTSSSFATQATWADYFRDSLGPKGAPHAATHNWHFADIEIVGGTLADACFDFPALPADTAASEGSPEDCVVDKITQFTAELKSPETPDDERLRALKYLLHFVGDVHQPLHSSDDHDAGGNGKNVTAAGFKAGKLHRFWDTEFVLRIAPTPDAISKELIRHITKAEIKQWSSPDPNKWAMESFSVARRKAYGALPPPTAAHSGTGKSYRLTQAYVDDAVVSVRLQLSKAGVRLAALLNDALR